MHIEEDSDIDMFDGFDPSGGPSCELSEPPESDFHPGAVGASGGVRVHCAPAKADPPGHHSSLKLPSSQVTSANLYIADTSAIVAPSSIVLHPAGSALRSGFKVTSKVPGFTVNHQSSDKHNGRPSTVTGSVDSRMLDAQPRVPFTDLTNHQRRVPSEFHGQRRLQNTEGIKDRRQRFSFNDGRSMINDDDDRGHHHSNLNTKCVNIAESRSHQGFAAFEACEPQMPPRKRNAVDAKPRRLIASEMDVPAPPPPSVALAHHSGAEEDMVSESERIAGMNGGSQVIGSASQCWNDAMFCNGQRPVMIGENTLSDHHRGHSALLKSQNGRRRNRGMQYEHHHHHHHHRSHHHHNGHPHKNALIVGTLATVKSESDRVIPVMKCDLADVRNELASVKYLRDIVDSMHMSERMMMWENVRNSRRIAGEHPTHFSASMVDDHCLPFGFDYIAHVHSGHQQRGRAEGSGSSSSSSLMTEYDRRVILDWIIEVHRRFELGESTLHLCLDLFDRYLSQKRGSVAHIGRIHGGCSSSSHSDQSVIAVKGASQGPCSPCTSSSSSSSSSRMITVKDRLLCVACACLWIASKYSEIYTPIIDDFLIISNHKFTPNELIQTEMDIITELDFQLTRVSSFHFVQRYVKIATWTLSRKEEKSIITNIILYCLEMSQQCYGLCMRYLPSTIAAACVCYAVCATKLISKQRQWNHIFVDKFGVRKKFNQLMPVMKVIHTLLINEDRKCQATRKKFRSKRFHQVSLLSFGRLCLEDVSP